MKREISRVLSGSRKGVPKGSNEFIAFNAITQSLDVTEHGVFLLISQSLYWQQMSESNRSSTSQMSRATRYTTFAIWVLGRTRRALPSLLRRVFFLATLKLWSWWRITISQPRDYKSRALPLCYTSICRYTQLSEPYSVLSRRVSDWQQNKDSNFGPTAYEADALPLSYFAM